MKSQYSATLLILVVITLSHAQIVLQPWQSTILCRVNTERTRRNLKPVAWNAGLGASASQWSRNMASQRRETHTREAFGVPGWENWIKQQSGAKWNLLSENIAKTQSSDPEKVMEMWMQSPTHNANILDPRMTDFGVGLSNNYWTQHFGQNPSGRSTANGITGCNTSSQVSAQPITPQQLQPESRNTSQTPSTANSSRVRPQGGARTFQQQANKAAAVNRASRRPQVSARTAALGERQGSPLVRSSSISPDLSPASQA